MTPPSRRSSGRKSWPQAETQWASSTTNSAGPASRTASTTSGLASCSGARKTNRTDPSPSDSSTSRWSPAERLELSWAARPTSSPSSASRSTWSRCRAISGQPTTPRPSAGGAGDGRRGDDDRAVEERAGDLVDRRLPGAGREDREGVPSGQDRLHRPLLARAELLEAEDVPGELADAERADGGRVAGRIDLVGLTSGWRHRRWLPDARPWQTVLRATAAGPRSAGARQSWSGCGEGLAEEDLGSVGAPGAPSAVGLSFDPEAVVDLGVVSFAEQRGVLQGRLAAVDPFEQVMDVAPPGRRRAAGEHAAPVAMLDGLAQLGGHDPGVAAQVEDRAVGAEEDAGDGGVAGGPAGAGGGDQRAAAEGGGAGPDGWIEEVFGVDADDHVRLDRAQERRAAGGQGVVG